MESTLVELAKQIPSLLVLVWLVFQHSKTTKEIMYAFRDEVRKMNSVIEHDMEVLSHVKFILQDKKEKVSGG